MVTLEFITAAFMTPILMSVLFLVPITLIVIAHRKLSKDREKLLLTEAELYLIRKAQTKLKLVKTKKDKSHEI